MQLPRNTGTWGRIKVHTKAPLMESLGDIWMNLCGCFFVFLSGVSWDKKGLKWSCNDGAGGISTDAARLHKCIDDVVLCVFNEPQAQTCSHVQTLVIAGSPICSKTADAIRWNSGKCRMTSFSHLYRTAVLNHINPSIWSKQNRERPCLCFPLHCGKCRKSAMLLLVRRKAGVSTKVNNNSSGNIFHPNPIISNSAGQCKTTLKHSQKPKCSAQPAPRCKIIRFSCSARPRRLHHSKANIQTGRDLQRGLPSTEVSVHIPRISSAVTQMKVERRQNTRRPRAQATHRSLFLSLSHYGA